MSVYLGLLLLVFRACSIDTVVLHIGHRACGNGEEEREGFCIKRATVSDYIHK
jgi:hypothetical protein